MVPEVKNYNSTYVLNICYKPTTVLGAMEQIYCEEVYSLIGKIGHMDIK